MTQGLGNKIRAIREKLGKDQAAFGRMVGTNQSTVARWERGAKPKPDALMRIAEVGKTTIDQLLTINENGTIPSVAIPVVGYVGAGAEVLPYDDFNAEGMDYVDRPPFVVGDAVAVEVKGDSLFPTAENGWKLVYAGEQTLIEEEVLNRLCVVQLLDGRIFVKRITRGSEPGLFHLLSTNAPAIENVRIAWAAKVKAIIPS